MLQKQQNMRSMFPPRNMRAHAARFLATASRASKQLEYFAHRAKSSTDSGARFWSTRTQLALFGASVGAGALFYATHLQTVYLTGRRQFVAITASEEAAIGDDTFQEMLAQHAGHILPDAHPVVQRVARIGRRIAAVSPLHNRQWTFTVIQSNTANCFVLPGQHVFLFTGILPIMRDDDGIAVVMGHEIAHTVAQHAMEKMTMYKAFIVVETIASLVLDFPRVLSRQLFTLVLALPFSRAMESEADRIGLDLVARACFNPGAAVGVFTRLDAHTKQHGDKDVPFLSTHPRNTTRVEQFKALLPESVQLLHRYCADRQDFMQLLQNIDVAQKL